MRKILFAGTALMLFMGISRRWASASLTPSRQRTNSLRAKRNWVTNKWTVIWLSFLLKRFPDI